jgi:hypothetical protein
MADIGSPNKIPTSDSNTAFPKKKNNLSEMPNLMFHL